MALNWNKVRRRDQANRARRDEIDASRYIAETYAIVKEPREGKRPQIATLKCACGHKGLINTARGQRFRCSKCGKRYWT